LTLLTTQLQNQNPLDPLDTNQFTQQLVEFASVEQQINMNTNLQSLITMQQTTQATSALQLVGSTVTVGGNSATLSNATSTAATWSLTTSTPATATVTVTNSSGSTAYSGTLSLNAGTQSFTWNGQGNNGQTWPDGTYTLSIKATGANGQAVTVSTQVQGVVSGVNLASNPPTLKVNGQNDQPGHLDHPLGYAYRRTGICRASHTEAATRRGDDVERRRRAATNRQKSSHWA